MRALEVTIIILLMDYGFFLFEAGKQLLKLYPRFTSRWVTAKNLQLCLLWLSFYFELFINSTSSNLDVTK